MSGGSIALTLLGGAASSSTPSYDPISALSRAEANQTKDIATEAATSSVKRDTNAFQAAIASARSPADLLKNPAFLKVFLTANGLADQLGYTALATKALSSKLSDPKSLANVLTDTRWKAVVQSFNFASKGVAAVSSAKVQSTLINGYAEVEWRQSLDAATPGLSNALTFRAQASSVTTADQILGDATLRKVVTTALGIPEQIAFQPLEAQEKAITSRLDLTRLKDRRFVESFAQKYLLTVQTANAPAAAPTLDTLAVQAGSLVV